MRITFGTQVKTALTGKNTTLDIHINEAVSSIRFRIQHFGLQYRFFSK